MNSDSTNKRKVSYKNLVYLLLLLLLQPKTAYSFDSLLEFESSSATTCSELKKSLSAAHASSLYQELHDKNKNRKGAILPVNPTWMGFLADWARGVKFHLYSIIDFGLNEVCANTYIVQPHEYLNMRNGWMKCETGTEGVRNKHPDALNQYDVPFYYSCDLDRYSQHHNVAPNRDAFFKADLWGYMGAASSFCIGKAKNYALKELVGMVRVEYAAHQQESTKCAMREGVFLKAGETKAIRGVDFTAFQHYDLSSDRVQICVATPNTSVPIIVGCSTIAPPPEKELIMASYILEHIHDTRCTSLFTGRLDLQTLGSALPELDEHSFNGQAMKMFLQSDFHITSTIIGCIKDLIMQVYLNPKISGKHGMLKSIQDNLQKMVYATLTLYITLIGIRIISSTQVPPQGELLMFIIKFALVLLFTSSDVWYYVEVGEVKGLFVMLFGISDSIAKIFLQASDTGDPVGLCHYWFQGQELLTTREINTHLLSGSSSGVHNIKMTIWDLLDCKFANYMNFGSCNYSSSGMVGMWITAASFLTVGNGFLLAIISFVYIWMLLLSIFKFAHVFILSMMILSILILISPIILCFSLFKTTQSIFQAWFRMIIGYSIFPGLLLMVISFVLVIFDNIYFGDLTAKAASLKHNQISIMEACQDVHSIFCTTVGVIAKDPCSANIGVLGEKFMEQVDLGALGSFNRAQYQVVQAYFQPVLKLMLFSLIIYFFTDAIISSLAVMTGISFLHREARGRVDIIAPTLSIGERFYKHMAYTAGNIIGNMTSRDREKDYYNRRQ